jgi:hypothetical protein
MKRLGMVLMLAGISLIAVLAMNVARKNRSVLMIEQGIASREITLIRLFTTIGTVLVIAGVGATVMAKRPD